MFIGNKIKSIENITMKHGDKRKVCVWCNLSAIPWNSRELYGGMLQSYRAFCPRFPSCCWLFACLEFHSPGIIFSSLLFINAGILTMMSLTPFKTLQRILGQKPLSPSVLRKSKSSSEQEGSCEAHTADRMPGWLECLALGEYFVLPALPTLPAAGAKQLHDSRGQPWPGVAALMVSVRVPVAPSCLNLKQGPSSPTGVPSHAAELRRAGTSPSFCTPLPTSPSSRQYWGTLLKWDAKISAINLLNASQAPAMLPNDTGYTWPCWSLRSCQSCSALDSQTDNWLPLEKMLGSGSVVLPLLHLHKSVAVRAVLQLRVFQGGWLRSISAQNCSVLNAAAQILGYL